MRMAVAIMIMAVSGLSTAHAQPVIPARPMPDAMPMPPLRGAPANPVVRAPVETDFIYRFSCEDKGTYYLCRNMIDPNDTVKIYPKNPQHAELYKAIDEKVANGGTYKILMDPATRTMAIARPKFDMVPMSIYAADMGRALEQAAEMAKRVKEGVGNEPAIIAALPRAFLVARGLEMQIRSAVKAAESILDIPENLGKEKQKKIVLTRLAALKAEVAAIGPRLDAAIRQAKLLVPGLTALVKTKVRPQAELDDVKEMIREMETARQAVDKAQNDIQVLINLHAD